MESVITTPELTDEAAAHAVQGGDVEAFGVLVERYAPKLTRYARKFLLRGDDAEDLIQEVFVKAYTNIQSFDAERKFSPWIYRIAHNEFITMLKRRSKIPMISLEPDVLFPHPVDPEAASDAAERNELKKMLDGMLTELPPKYREPLVLFYYEDMDYKTIAEVLQIPVPTVGIRLRRGKAALQEMISRSKYTP